MAPCFTCLGKLLPSLQERKNSVGPSAYRVIEAYAHLCFWVYHRNNTVEERKGLSWLLGCLTWKYIYLLIARNLCFFLAHDQMEEVDFPW